MASSYVEGSPRLGSGWRSVVRGLIGFVLVGALVAHLPTRADAQQTGGRVGGFGGGAGSGSTGGTRPGSWGGASGARRDEGPPPRSWASENPEAYRQERELAAAESRAREAWAAARRDAGIAPVSSEERAALAEERIIESDAYMQGLIGFAAGSLPILLVGMLIASAVRKRELRRLTIAFGPEVRASLQEQLRGLAGRADPRSPTGRRELAERALALMREHHAHARYTVWSATAHRRAEGTKRFFRLAQDLRSRYTHETVGSRAAPTPVTRPHREEGPGLIVVSLILFDEPGAKPLPTKVDVAAALDAFAARSPEGAELIWSPAEPEDRLSSAELEVLYPELARIGADVGRVACSHCRAVYARELGTCPACGASAPA